MVNMKAALLTTVLGFLSVGTALSNAVDLNPSHGDIVDAVAHADPEARSFGGPEPLLSNAQRFARGLPPAKPASVQRVARSPRTGRERIQRRAGSSPLPLPPVKGKIQVDIYDSEASFLGYVSKTLNQFGQYGNLEPNPLLFDNILSVQIPGNVFLGGGSFYNLAGLNTQAGFPFVGGVVGYSNTDENLSAGSYNVAYFAEVNRSPVQSTGQNPGNSFSSISGFERNSQSAIWSYDPLTQSLSIIWTNPNNSPKSVINPAVYYFNNGLGWTGDFAVFEQLAPGATRVRYTFVPDV